MKELQCPTCGQKSAHCSCHDIGFIDYHDRYTLKCHACGHTESKTEYGGSPNWDNWDTVCPFCGKTQGEHSRNDNQGENSA